VQSVSRDAARSPASHWACVDAASASTLLSSAMKCQPPASKLYQPRRSGPASVPK
jgi:hypothetical protein